MKSRRRSWSALFLLAAAWSSFGNAPAAQTSPMRYDGQMLVRAYLQNSADAQVVSAAGARLFGCNEGIGPVDYLVSAEGLALLEANGISYQVLDGDVQASLDAERQRLSSAFKTFSVSWFSEFKDFDAIVGQMQAWAVERPDLVTLADIGDSLEGRDL